MCQEVPGGADRREQIPGKFSFIYRSTLRDKIKIKKNIFGKKIFLVINRNCFKKLGQRGFTLIVQQYATF